MSDETPQFDLTIGINDEDRAAATAPATILEGNDGEAELGPDGLPPADTPFIEEKPEECVPASERIDDLFAKMGSVRVTLLRTIRACEQAKPVAEVNELIDHLQEHNKSVFTAADLCHLLQRAGALELVAEDGSPYKEAQRSPHVVESDEPADTDVQAEPADGSPDSAEAEGESEGARLEVVEPAVAYWRTTEDGLAAARADDPASRIEALFEGDSLYLPIYKCILNLAAREGGVKTPALGAAINNLELVQHPRLFVTHFVERLEKAGAIEWTGSWTITDEGLVGAESIADVEDIEVADDIDDARAVDPDYDWLPLEG